MATPLNPALEGLSRGKQFLDKQIGDRFINYFVRFFFIDAKKSEKIFLRSI